MRRPIPPILFTDSDGLVAPSRRALTTCVNIPLHRVSNGLYLKTNHGLVLKVSALLLPAAKVTDNAGGFLPANR